MTAFARPVDHTAHHGDVHAFDAGILRAPERHLAAQIPLDAVRQFLEKRAAGTAAAGARDHHRREGAQAHGLQDFLRHDGFAAAVAAGFGRERNADGVADALLQQYGQRGRGCHDALAAHAGFGQAQVQRVVATCGQVAVDGDQVLHVADLARQDDGVAAQAELFSALGVADGRHDQRIAHHRLGLPGLRAAAVFVHLARHQLVIQAAPVHADAHGLVVTAGHFDHLGKIVVAALAATHVARVDPVLGQRLGAFGKLRQQLVAVVVEIAHQRHVHAHPVELFADGRDFTGRLGRVHRDPHELGAGLGQLLDLYRRGDGVRRVGVGHGLDHDRGIAAHRHDTVAPLHRHRTRGAAHCGPHVGRRRILARQRRFLHRWNRVTWSASAASRTAASAAATSLARRHTPRQRPAPARWR
ncbi:hypothetical protein FQZ97_605520 [compost metagenome]